MSNVARDRDEYLTERDITIRSIPKIEEEDDDYSDQKDGEEAPPAPKKGSKRDFAVFGFNPISTEIKLPMLTGQRTIDYIKWSKEVLSKLKALGISCFITSDETQCMKLAIEDDDGYHTKEAVKRMVLIVHSRVAASIRVASAPILGSSFFEELEDLHRVEMEKHKSGQRDEAPFIDGNAYVLWNRIKKKLNRRTDADTQFLYNKIQNLKYQYGKDPIDLKRRFDELKRELLTLGFDGITEKMSKMLWLNYIPKELEAIKQSMECRSSYDTDDIYNALYANYVRSLAENRGKFAKKNQREQQANEVSETKKHHKLKEKDKWSKANHQTKAKGDSNSKDSYCTFCKRNGHKNDTCWKLELQTLRKQVANMKTNQPEELSYIESEPAGSQDSDEVEEGAYVLTELFTQGTLYDEYTIYPFGDKVTLRKKPDEDPYTTEEIESMVIDSEETHETICTLTEDEVDSNNDTEPEEASAAYGELVNREVWLLDSGAQRNITPFKEVLNEVKKLKQPITMVAANGARMQAKYSGQLRLTQKRIVSEVLWLPQARRNLLSESRILEKRTPIYKDSDFCYFLRKPIRFRPEDYFLRIPRNPKSGMFEFSRRVNNNGDIISDISGSVHKAFKDVSPPMPPSSASSAVSNIRRPIPKRSTGAAMSMIEPDSTDESENDAGEAEFTLFLEESFAGELQYLSTPPTSLVDLYHRRLGHAGVKKMLTAAKKKQIPVSEREIHVYFKNGKPSCCLNSIPIRTPVSSERDKAYVATRPLQCLWYDLLGPMSARQQDSNKKKKTRTQSGHLYLLVIVDEYSRAVFAFPLKRKSEAKELIQQTILKLQVRTGYQVERVRNDRAKDFLNKDMEQFCKQHGIYQAPTPAYSPSLNGLVERMNRSIFEVARPLLIQASADHRLWGEAAIWAVFLLNVTPNTHLEGLTPFHVLFNYNFDLRKTRIFGCDAHIMHSPKDQTHIQTKTWKGIFIGFDFEQGLYKILDLTGKIHYERNIQWEEQSFKHVAQMSKTLPHKVYKTKSATRSQVQSESTKLIPELASYNPFEILPSNSNSSDDETEDSDYEVLDLNKTKPAQNPKPSQPQEAPTNIANPPPPPKRRHQLTRETKALQGDKFKEWNHWTLSLNNAHQSEDSYILNVEELMSLAPAIPDEPSNHKEAMSSPQKQEWLQAEHSEICSLKKLKAYEEVALPQGKVALPSRMIYKIKRGPNGEITRYKVRLVAGGHRQVFGRDYDETFSPVAKMKSIKLFLAIASERRLVIKQIDFDTAFLNAPLEEEVYIKPPKGYEHSNPNVVWKLKRSLYGLKQAGRNWYIQLDKSMKDLGFTPLVMDPCIYTKTSKTHNLMIISLYVDDELIACHKKDVEEWLQIKESLSKLYDLKDLDQAQWILNMKVTVDPKGTIALNQKQYTKDLLAKFGMAEAKPDKLPYGSEPVQMTLPEGKEGEPLSTTEHERYRSIIGGLLYLANLTRIDICYIVNRLDQFCHTPMVHHMTAAKRVMRYLAGTLDYGLVFEPNVIQGKDINQLIVYSDADWAADNTSRKSISGGILLYNGNLIHWFSKKQELTAQSTMEAEYIAMHACTKDIIWFQQWLLPLSGNKPHTTLLCDNTSAIISSKTDKNHQRTRHIDVRYHLVRDHVMNNNMKVEYIPTESQLADCLTKPLNHNLFAKFIGGLLHRT